MRTAKGGWRNTTWGKTWMLRFLIRGPRDRYAHLRKTREKRQSEAVRFLIREYRKYPEAVEWLKTHGNELDIEGWGEGPDKALHIAIPFEEIGEDANSFYRTDTGSNLGTARYYKNHERYRHRSSGA